MSTSHSDHFAGKDPYEHILQKKSEVAREMHGDELPGHLGAFLDTCRDTCMLFLMFAVIAFVLDFSRGQVFGFLILLTFSWTIWKTIRSAWFSWSLLERLHRVLKEEKYEIEHNREQEREELTALYASKGLQGELLKDVIDVLMADDERLLKVMMEEEMGLNLEHYEHPLKIGLGAALGALGSGLLLVLSFWFFKDYGLVALAVIVQSIAGVCMAKLQRNDMLAAFIWNFGASLALIGSSYFLSKWIQPFL